MDFWNAKLNRIIKTLGILYTILMLPIFLQGCASAKEKQPTAAELQIAFKLDPRLSGGTYGGEHWVPPPYGPITFSKIYTLEARAYYIDTDEQQVEVNAEWIPADPNLVTISPDRGNQVSITIQGIGETSVLVKTSQGISKSLHVKAIAQNDRIQVVEISQ